MGDNDLMLRVIAAVWTRRPHSRLVCEWLLVDASLPWTDPPCGIHKCSAPMNSPTPLKAIKCYWPFLLWHSKNQYHLVMLVHIEKPIIITFSWIPPKSMLLVNIFSRPLSVFVQLQQCAASFNTLNRNWSKPLSGSAEQGFNSKPSLIWSLN